ncbi:DUF4136 domain-containing protein [Gramella sp. GC03-9]|uniref:DUF4136 domain-containing protein n=1 Tax=Christiangramia oceanisediminis TaxID=2920386 RepID=A0A9X2I3L5_9FLAO|nr:DUF4136 domain-containing protein [Gramella oceanisediminis]MCP9200090.1 DUF4136 domain-containing protein [Gramella oceanisediminis]
MKSLNLMLFIMALTLIGCGPRVNTSQPTEVNLGKYDSFAYLPNTNAEVENRNYNDEEVNATIVDVINKNLKQEGYALDRENPDLLVLVSTKVDQEVARDVDPAYATYPYTTGVTAVNSYYEPYYYYGYTNYNSVVGYNTDTYSYEEGTLVVQLVDSETKNTVWRGVASNDIYNQTTVGGIQDMVNDIFKEYPLNK